MNREGEPQQLSEREKAVLEVDKTQQTFEEAFDRLEGSDDYNELAALTSSGKQSPDEIEKFLFENESRLSPEGKFFLEMTINLR